ncbi:ribosomal L28e/Mak16 [Coprinopsis sp. MPI-PUGE-AT-0042]|nr:ribosomal L28e/Mak16 [Coprinopsis sp. MPI-PUGE-AT-0042]
MSDDLQWLLLRKSNAFIVKRVPEGPIFSREAGNLRNLHSFKYSGLANSKTIAIADSPSGITITTRKPKASVHSVAGASVKTTIRPRSGGRRALGSAAAATTKRGYRPDLRAATLARVSALIAAQKEPKASRPKKVRGNKKATTA